MTDKLPQSLYFAHQIKLIEQRAHSEYGIVPSRLMKYAGRAAHEYLYNTWPDTKHVMIFCGAGNNAGDGFVMAALAAQKRQSVSVVLLSDANALKGAAKQAYNFAQQESVTFIGLDEAEQYFDVHRAAHNQFADYTQSAPHTVIVDAILGSGVNRDITGDYLKAITLINQTGCPVLGIDIPSGIHADTGFKMGAAVKCVATISFVGLKVGLFTANAPAFTGKITFDNLGLPDAIFNDETLHATRIDRHTLKTHPFINATRNGDAHKGEFGHVLVVGGDNAMGGAAILASESAVTAGAGRVSCATQPQHVVALLSRTPEVMACGVRNGQDLPDLYQAKSVICIGPGLGQSPWSEQLLQAVTLTDNALVMDADALNFLAQGRVIRETKRSNWVLTPHPGEAARLLDCSTHEIQQNRLDAAKKLQVKYGGVIILKGAGTVIVDQNQHFIAQVGTPAMAVAGMGDVLSGIIAALIAQGLTPIDAATLGVCVHGYAGELAAKADGERGLKASTLTAHINKVINTYE